ncbi:MAG: SMI1/KNR4 family protein [Spirulina sp. SIO3F2]|nr:SMI1/KNR4 family protein [Spirulina sp. SIO3F2]
MSQLTEALNRIMNWLQEYQPDYAASFLPGLSRQEIDEITAPLNLYIPEEIYELYQWRNGRSVVPFIDTDLSRFEIYEFLPLKEAASVDSIKTINRSTSDGGFLTTEYKSKKFFPFIGRHPETCAVVISDKQEEKYPIVALPSEEIEPSPCCASITVMMSICAEAYETEVFYVKDEEPRFMHTDHVKLIELCDKYNAWY